MKTRRDYHRESTRPDFQLKLDNPPKGHPGYVVFKDPGKIRTESAFSIARNPDPEDVARALLSDEDFALWWGEWRDAPADETNSLLEDVQAHYGADRGKASR